MKPKPQATKPNPEALLPRFLELPNESSRLKYLKGHRQLVDVEVVTRLTERVYQEAKADPRRALALAEAALTLARQLRDKEVLAESMRAKANALYFVSDNRSAVAHHIQALALFEEVSNDAQIARTLSASIQPLILLGEFERAFAAAERARQIFTTQGDTWRLARMLTNEGNIYFRLDRFAEALGCYERAYEGLLPHRDHDALAAALSNMASCLISLGNFPRALATYERARAYCAEHGLPVLVAMADYNIAYLYYFRGEYSRAIDMLRAARQEAKALGDEYQFALCQYDLAEIHLDLNLAEKAAELAREAYARFQELGMGYEAAKSMANLAIALGQQGKASRALRLFARARRMFVREKNLVWTSLTDLYQALVLFNEGRIVEARRLCLSALEFFNASALPGKAVLCHLLLARVHLRIGDPKEALQECLAALRRLNTMDSPVLSHQAHLLLGQVQEAAGKRQPAYDSYQAARQTLERLRSGLRSEELKIAFVKNRLEVYENLVQLCLQGDPSPAACEEAFSYMEQAKSRTLIDLMFQPIHAPAGSEASESDLVRCIREVREELNWYYNLIQREQLAPGRRSPERIAKLRHQTQVREREFLRMLRELPASEFEFSSLQAPTTMPLELIRQGLVPGVVLVEYFRIHDRIVAALLTRESLDIIPLTAVSRVRELLRLLRFQLSKFRLGPDYVERYQTPLLEATNVHLRELYEELIAPARDRIQGEHIIFIPHDILHYAPLHALFDGERYLIDQFTVSYAPSAGIYSLCHGKVANQVGASLVLGVPDPQAPHILDEVHSVAGILPQSELFVGGGATEEVLRTKGPQCRLLHIATHGHFRQDNPMFSSIGLGGSYLGLYDLYGLRLPVELATLSGCATGMNVVTPGDELLGLVRGLLYAGAQSLLLTLWEVHDRSTAEFMRMFYRRLVDHRNRARALQEAMQDTRGRFPHPYYWAPFLLVGKAFS